MLLGLAWWTRWERIHLQCERYGFDPWVGKIPLQEEMVTHSSLLAGKTPWTEKPGGLLSMGPQRVGHDWACTQQQGFSKSTRCRVEPVHFTQWVGPSQKLRKGLAVKGGEHRQHHCLWSWKRNCGCEPRAATWDSKTLICLRESFQAQEALTANRLRPKREVWWSTLYYRKGRDENKKTLPLRTDTHLYTQSYRKTDMLMSTAVLVYKIVGIQCFFKMFWEATISCFMWWSESLSDLSECHLYS